jgi:hypothetical protein
MLESLLVLSLLSISISPIACPTVIDGTPGTKELLSKTALNLHVNAPVLK